VTAIRLDYASQSERTRGDKLWISQHCVLRAPGALVLSLYSLTPDGDERTFDEIVESFEFV
jgi:hypothetical protein